MSSRWAASEDVFGLHIWQHSLPNMAQHSLPKMASPCRPQGRRAPCPRRGHAPRRRARGGASASPSWRDAATSPRASARALSY
eukprot:5030420-Prymnesium_polylepis.1